VDLVKLGSDVEAAQLLQGKAPQPLRLLGGKACLSFRKHDHFTPTREIRRHVRANYLGGSLSEARDQRFELVELT